MLSGLQVPAATSYATMVRSETAPHRSSGVGNSRGMQLFKSPKVSPKKTAYPHVFSHAGKHLPSRPDNLETKVRRQSGTLPDDKSLKNLSANIIQNKSRLPKDDSWKYGASKDWHAHSKDEQRSKTQMKSRIGDPKNVMGSMASLSISVASKPGPVLKGNFLYKKRATFTSSTNSKASLYLSNPDRDFLRPTPSVYSVMYTRRHDQTPMEKATYREYLPFFKSEFKVGMIIRMNIHESDFKGPSKPEIAQASPGSSTPLVVDGARPNGRRQKVHRHHGDFGPIYSENRICIVVNVAEDVYTAIPLFTHKGRGSANVLDKRNWVSVEDHRRLGTCIQQTEHPPLRTASLSAGCNILHPVSAAWIPFAFPCRYDVPVAYQGKLDRVSAKRLVRLHRKTWVDDAGSGDEDY